MLPHKHSALVQSAVQIFLPIGRCFCMCTQQVPIGLPPCCHLYAFPEQNHWGTPAAKPASSWHCIITLKCPPAKPRSFSLPFPPIYASFLHGKHAPRRADSLQKLPHPPPLTHTSTATAKQTEILVAEVSNEPHCTPVPLLQ